MISKKETKEIAKKYKKKIGNKSVQKLDNLVNEYVERIIRNASKKADFKGNVTIKEEDI